MSHIVVTIPHQLSSLETARQILEEVRRDPVVQRWVKDIRTHARGDVVAYDVRGRHFDGSVVVDEEAIDVRVKLGLVARPFRAQIERGIHHHVQQRLNQVT